MEAGRLLLWWGAFFAVGPGVWLLTGELHQAQTSLLLRAASTWVPAAGSMYWFLVVSRRHDQIAARSRAQAAAAAAEAVAAAGERRRQIGGGVRGWLSSLRGLLPGGVTAGEESPRSSPARRSPLEPLEAMRLQSWLSFWMLWPCLSLMFITPVLHLIGRVHDGTPAEAEQSDGGFGWIVARLAIVAIVWLQLWLQYWGGSYHVGYLVDLTAQLAALPLRLVMAVLPAGGCLGRVVSFSQLGQVMAFLTTLKQWAQDSPAVALPFIGSIVMMVLYIIFTFVGAVGSAVSTAIILAAAVKTSRALTPPAETEKFTDELAFWLLVVVLDLLIAIPIPLIGTFFRFAQPTLLIVIVLHPGVVLQFLLTRAEGLATSARRKLRNLPSMPAPDATSCPNGRPEAAAALVATPAPLAPASELASTTISATALAPTLAAEPLPKPSSKPAATAAMVEEPCSAEKQEVDDKEVMSGDTITSLGSTTVSNVVVQREQGGEHDGEEDFATPKQTEEPGSA